MASAATRYLRYILYGVLTCAALILPWMAVDEMLRRLPGGDAVEQYFRGFGLPGALHVLILAVVAALALGLIGWLSHRFLWPRLENVPLFRNLLPGVERLTSQLGAPKDGHGDRVVWVAWPSAQVRTLGIVTGRVRDPETGHERLAVVLLPSAGNVKTALLRVVGPDQVEITGWTLDEAIGFVTSSGTMGPDEVKAHRAGDVSEPKAP